MAIKLWFNRWFSTVTHYIEMIRENPDRQSFIIHGTHSNPDAVYLNSCDVSGIEPDVNGEEYLEFCLDYCRQNQIDVFIPRKENVMISRQLKRFQEIGVKVLVCPDGDLMALLDNKVSMYRSLEEKMLEGHAIVPLPAYRIVRTADEFKQAYAELAAQGMELCLKPVVGEGANGFWVLDEIADTIQFLFNTASSRKISYASAYKLLQQQREFPDLMILEYLDGFEYSIDCLADGEGNLYTAIPRKKGNGRIREIEYNEELLEIARKIAQHYKIPYVFNIQVKYKDGVPKLLEINPRMSGGLHISCLSGVNVPYYAVKLLLKGTIEPLYPNFGIKATHIEQAVVLSREL
ncbi:ATP-grasp domain-containing protein [Planococcus sp. YIM B11945]|uniref:ATP-grasp domain-containing protein n=1 Tax=Planococcus sp. YIM B11945 TaxID=3435410 RepID=UPI003D7D62B2